MNTAPKTIALVDWTWGGHHAAYFGNFLAALESLGHRVVGLCPNPEDARRVAEMARQEFALATDAGEPLIGPTRTPKRRFSALRPRWITAIDFAIRRFRGVEEDAKRLAAEAGGELDLIFFAGIYDWDFDRMYIADRFLRVPWTGLYMYASALRLREQPWARLHRRMFDARGCRGVGVLDEGIVGALEEACGKPVVAFPDIAVGHGMGQTTVLSQKLRDFSRGAPVVGLLGYLEPRKGLLPFLRMAVEMRNENVCFALAGELVMPQEALDGAEVRRLVAELPNLWCHFAPLDDGPQFNAVLSSCDVIYAAYLGFPFSSNLLTKAAMLKKPVLVSDGYLMAERVRRYRLGEVIREGDVREGVRALKRLTAVAEGQPRMEEPRYNDYAEQHGSAALRASMGKLLALYGA